MSEKNEALDAEQGEKNFFRRALRFLQRDRSLHGALFIFLLTRTVIFVIFILATHLTFIDPNRRYQIDPQDTRISLRDSNVAEKLRALVPRGDGEWYQGIAINGYERAPFDAKREHNWVFFPLYPLLWRLAAKLTGGYLLTGMALSNLLFLPALVLLHKTALAFGSDERAATRTIFYLAIYPTSYFFSLGMSESLFLLLTVASFYAAKREKWWLASLMGALACVTRSSGIFLMPALALLYWQSHRSFKLRPQLLSLLLIPVGLLFFMMHLYFLTGDPLAFAHAQAAWGRRPVFFLHSIIAFLSDPLVLSAWWDFKLLNLAAVVLAFACIYVLVKWREWSLAFYTLISVMLPLSSLTTLQSNARYAMVMFPIFIVLGRMGARSVRFDMSISVIFLVLLGLMSALSTAIFTFVLS